MTHQIKLFIVTSFLSLLVVSGSFANDSQKHKSGDVEISNYQEKDIKPNSNEVVLVVHGVVCSFCSYGIQKKLSKLDFVDVSKFNKKGSKVNIENQRVTIAIKPGFKADVDVIFEAIKSGGYKPIIAYVADDKGKVQAHNPE
jgi:thioredoxin-related protein